ncbi:neuronal acetylcholine receptor subunit eat-2-like isoform X3 [Symsagittifera roscoffensis]|uniref:neuronal acetylcholine receptor subunit eat-2-like isoform X3 n=1 Tax=Symsagittifera roscoffensis TaxID=84072 RepID=UPI00307C1B92
MLSKVLYATAVLLIFCWSSCSNTSPESFSGGYVGYDLMQEIFANSSPSLRPVTDHSRNTTVFFRLLLYQILGVDSVQGKVHLHFWAEMVWLNELISWSPERHGNIGRIDLQVREMWMPDIIFFTQLTGEHFNEGFPSPPALLSNGITMVLKPFKAELVCVMDAWYFPYDRQSCSFEVGSWAHFASEIDIRPKEEGPADMKFFQPSSVFDVDTFQGQYVTYKDPSLEANDTMFSCIVFSLSFKRKPTYFMLNVILPSILINFLCIFNFIIPCETGEKVGYGITVFLAQSVNLMVVSEMMPQGGNSVLGCFLVASILLIALSLFMQIVTMSIFFANSKARAPPSFRTFCNFIRKFVGPFYRLGHEQIGLANRNVHLADVAPAEVARPSLNGNNNAIPFSVLPKVSPNLKQNGISNNKNQGRFGDRILEDGSEDEFPETSYSMRELSEVGGRNTSVDFNLPPSYFNSRRVSVGVPKQRLSLSAPFPTPNNRISKSGSLPRSSMVSDHNHFTLFENSSQELSEMEIMEEWKVLANVLNRFNGGVFAFLLFAVLSAYGYWHGP